MVAQRSRASSYKKPATKNPTEINWITITSLLQSPIAYHRIFAEIGGGACAGLFLSQAFYWCDRGWDSDGWFYKTVAEWQDETGLTRYEQETARSRLVERGLLEEEKRGMPRKLYFRINKAAIMNAIVAQIQKKEAETSQNQQSGVFPPTSKGKTTQQASGKPPNKQVEKPPTGDLQNPFPVSFSSAKNPPEITTENTHTSAPNAPHPSQESVCVDEIGIEKPKEEIHQLPVNPDEQAIPKSPFGIQSQIEDRSSKPRTPHVDQNSAAAPLNKNLQKPEKWACPGTAEEKREFLKFKGQLMVRDGLCSSVESSTRALAWANSRPEEAGLLFDDWLAAGKPSSPRNLHLHKPIEVPDFDTWDGDRHLAILDKYKRMSDAEFLAECSWYANWIDWVKANKPEKLVKNPQ